MPSRDKMRPGAGVRDHQRLRSLGSRSSPPVAVDSIRFAIAQKEGIKMLVRRTASARGWVVLLCSSVLFPSAVRCHGGDIIIGSLRYSDVTAKLVSEVPSDLDEKTTSNQL